MMSKGVFRRSAARPIALVLLLGAACLLYWPVVQSLADLWLDSDNPTYGHGLLLMAVSIWMLWFRRADLLHADDVPAHRLWRAAFWVLLVASVLLWQLMYRAGIQVGYLFMWPAIAWTAIGVGVGPRAALASKPALAMLYFAIPIWDVLGPPAQWATVYAVRAMLRIVDVPAFFHGNLVQIPSGSFEIQGGCSGLNYLIVGLAVATLLGELRRDDWRGRLRWWVLAALLAVLTNWIRVFVVIVAGHLTHMQSYLVRESHYGFGWVLFAMALAVLILIERRTPLQQSGQGRTSPQTVAGAHGPASMWAGAVVALFVMAVPAMANLHIASRVDAQQISLRAGVNGWQELATDGGSWQPEQSLADGERLQNYTRNGRQVQVYLAWYGEQRQRKKLGGYDNRLQGEESVIEQGMTATGRGQFSTLHTRGPGQQDALIWYQYRVGDRSFTSATRAQLWYSWRTMLGLRTPLSSVLAIRMSCDGDCEAASEQLREIVAQIRMES